MTDTIATDPVAGARYDLELAEEKAAALRARVSQGDGTVTAKALAEVNASVELAGLRLEAAESAAAREAADASLGEGRRLAGSLKGGACTAAAAELARLHAVASEAIAAMFTTERLLIAEFDAVARGLRRLPVLPEGVEVKDRADGLTRITVDGEPYTLPGVLASALALEAVRASAAQAGQTLLQGRLHLPDLSGTVADVSRLARGTD